jgi:hypothetical protein
MALKGEVKPMLRNAMLFGLLILCVNVSCPLGAFAQEKKSEDETKQPVAQSQKQTKHARKIKETVAKLGVGPDAKIKVKLRDQSEIKGYVSDRAEEQFVITDQDTAVGTTLTYEQVEKVDPWTAGKTMMKRDFSSPRRLGKKLGITAAIIAGAVVVLCVTTGCEN